MSESNDNKLDALIRGLNGVTVAPAANGWIARQGVWKTQMKSSPTEAVTALARLLQNEVERDAILANDRRDWLIRGFGPRRRYTESGAAPNDVEQPKIEGSEE